MSQQVETKHHELPELVAINFAEVTTNYFNLLKNIPSSVRTILPHSSNKVYNDYIYIFENLNLILYYLKKPNIL